DEGDIVEVVDLGFVSGGLFPNTEREKATGYVVSGRRGSIPGDGARTWAVWRRGVSCLSANIAPGLIPSAKGCPLRETMWHRAAKQVLGPMSSRTDLHYGLGTKPSH